MIGSSAGSRTTASAVTFAFPFRLGEDPRELPPGIYSIFTHEDTYLGSFDPVYVAVEVELVVETGGGRTSRLVRPIDLQLALERDAALGERV
jgi:hypothetical protein